MSEDEVAETMRNTLRAAMADAVADAGRYAQAKGLSIARGSAIMIATLNDLTSCVISSLPTCAHESLLVECDASLRRIVSAQSAAGSAVVH
ncbi:hypothetical protein [Novosphingobium olei]|uniref:hypothetical protein n=1 Tax=Novosphingobium olei TaxID=2728851 RepID=UPI0030915331|nr:hypothetical protein NSDW_33160 [Novosphingobium olei]